jgi:Domain of unknown function (DUF4112)
MQRAFQRMEPGQRAQMEQAVTRLDALATLMDAAFIIPGTNTRMGLAGIIGFIPGIGDLIGGAISSYIVWEARQLGAPTWLIARMMLNVMIETGVGAVPILGDMFDILFRANLKNVALLKQYLARQGIGPSGPTIDGTVWHPAV